MPTPKASGVSGKFQEGKQRCQALALPDDAHNNTARPEKLGLINWRAPAKRLGNLNATVGWPREPDRGREPRRESTRSTR